MRIMEEEDKGFGMVFVWVNPKAWINRAMWLLLVGLL